jgi:hypothetical protein
MKKFTVTIVIMLLLSGCDDFLDKTDPTATSFVEFFNTEEDLRRVVYSSYLDVFTEASTAQLLFYMNDAKSDNAYGRIEDHHSQLIANGNFNSNTAAFLYYYELHMKHLGRLNTFIANADVPYVEDEAVRMKYKSILEALRLWHYFRLTFWWGDVPFHLEPATIAEARQPATPKEEILEYLFTEAEKIAGKLPPYEYTTDKYMFNRYSLKALVMRYALYNQRYELAARLAKEIMDCGIWEIHPVYGDLFQYKACSKNKEFIIHMNRESNGNSASYSFEFLGPHYRTGNGQSYVVPLKSLVDAYWTKQGRKIDECPLHSSREYQLHPSLNRDPRYAASIMGNGDNFYGETIDIYNENSPMYYEDERASKSGYWFKKFVAEEDAFKSGGTMEYGILRYAEVLLTYAEAKIMLNDVDALTKSCINQIRARAGLDMTVADVTLAPYSGYNQQQWIDLIRNERRIEFAGEGLRYDDIKRWRIAEQVLNQPALGHTREVNGELVSLKIEDRTFKPHNYMWPFHENSLRVEPGLKQNEGY